MWTIVLIAHASALENHHEKVSDIERLVRMWV